MNGDSRGAAAEFVLGTVLVLAVILAVVFAGLAIAGCNLSRPEAGKIGVIRNGGPIDNRSIKGVLEPGSGTTFIGWFSSARFYPTDQVQRFYTIASDPTARGDAVDVVRVPSSDGVRLGVEGTFFFRTGFNGTKEGEELVKAFDNQFGVRTFSTSEGNELHPFDGDDGWGAFLNAIVRPVIDNELREAVAKYRCEELYSSCQLVVSQGRAQVTESGQQNTVNLNRIQEDVQEGVTQKLTAALGRPYIQHVTFRLVGVAPDDEIQGAINEALAAFAQVSKSQALVEQAEQQRIAAEKLATVYEKSPALAQIQMIREAKDLPHATIYIGVSPQVVTK